MPDKKKKADRKSLWRYKFDTFMARGGTSIFKALTAVFLFSFFVIGLFRSLFAWLNPDAAMQYENIGVIGGIYLTWLQLTDPGNMAQDILSSPGYKIFSVSAGIVGLIMLSALIAFITTALDQKINELKRGHSKVIEEGHTLLLGWNPQRIIEILRELIIANESEDDACVVILADKDKEEMDTALRLAVPEPLSTRIVTRSGNVADFANLDMVSIDQADAAIILADCEDTDSAERKMISDAKAIQTVLAATGKNDDEDFSVIVEIYNPTYREIVSSAFPDNVITINTSDILAKLLVQTSRSVGLSIVYSEILSFDGCEMYFHEDDWDGINFGKLAYHFPDGVPMGVRQEDGTLTMRPDPDYVLADDDEILILADDDSTIEFLPDPVATPKEFTLADARLPQTKEKELLIGWNHKSPVIISEFAEYVSDSSEICILLKDPTPEQVAEIKALDKEHKDINIKLIKKDPLNREHLLSLKPFTFDNIIILAGSEGEDVDAQQIDSENIVALLLLRSIFQENNIENQKTKLITEVLDSQNYPLVARAGVKDVIISNRLISMIMSQVSESSGIKAVYDDIFQEDGSEIYLKPAALYFEEFPVDVSFADVMHIAGKREEIALGVKFKALEGDDEENNGVKLIPLKTESFVLTAEDSLVVLSEDEL